MTPNTMMALTIGTGAMLILIMIMMKLYRVRMWKGIPVAIILTVTGTISTYIWYFIESARFGAQSYYGAVFLVPLAFVYVAKLLRIPYTQLLDFCAPAECVMLAIMKYRCSVDGCCAGKVLLAIAMDGSIVFPSQIAELINALIIMIILLVMAFFGKNRGRIYPWYMVIYGGTRFVLNLFRADTTPVLLGLPIGNIWSILAVFLGVLWLMDKRLTIVKKPERIEEG